MVHLISFQVMIKTIFTKQQNLQGWHHIILFCVDQDTYVHVRSLLHKKGKTLF